VNQTATAISEYPFLELGGEMGRLTRNFDWAKTSLGAPDQWPQSLRTTVGNLLRSKFPMFLWWGEELIQFYNDAYRPSLGVDGKHPSALGAKGKDCWPEIWDIIAPLLEQVETTGEATWMEDQLIPIYRNGKLEDVYWTYSYSSVLDDEGMHAGILVTCTETTEKVKNLRALKENEEKYRGLFQSMDQGFCVLEMIFDEADRPVDYRFLEINPVFEAQTGMKDAVGKTAKELVPDLESHWFELYGKVATTGEATRFVQGSDAMGRWFDVYAYNTGSPTERKVALLFTDITEWKKADEKIRLSEQNLRNTILQSPVAMCIFKGPQFVVEIANERMFEFWGKEGSAFLGKPIFEGLPEAKDQGFESLLESVYTTGQTVKAYSVPVTLPRNGVVEEVYVDFVYEAYREQNDTIAGVMAVAIEVTEQVRARKKTEESEQRFQNLVREANVGIAVLMGEEMTVSVVNAAYGRLFNRTTDELLNKPIFEIIPDAEKPFRHLLDKVRLTGEPLFLNDTPYLVNTNQEKIEGYLNVAYQPYRETDGRITGVMALVQDVTEQVVARQKLEEAHERARLAIEAGELGTIEVNLQTDETIISERMEEIFETKTGTDRALFVSKMHPDDLPLRSTAYEKAMRDGHLEYETRVLKSDGSLSWIRAKGRVFFDETGKPLRLVSVVQDITKEKAFAEELQKLVSERTKELERSNLELQQFAHVASHDLKEPVRKIRTFGSRMRMDFETALPDKAKMYLAKIENAATRMYSMIDGVLHYSSLNAHQQVIEQVDLNEIFEQIQHDLEILIQEKSATIKLSELPIIEGSSILLYQLFYNLLNNSLKFAKADTAPMITIGSEIMEAAIQNGNMDQCALIRVEDNGIGFEQTYAFSIFDTFYRLNPKDRYEGTGLGLTLCKKIAERHRGSITAEGSIGQGAIMTVLLPLKQA